ncbi:helix-turn-helix domain-containing protein [Oceanobacter mangrovi]|uniref:helix-turn-helix domain-containing protein n=1 Tax=Oceanobacter mangrovi TaxID=2862510 RepID=UPI001C8DE4E1
MIEDYQVFHNLQRHKTQLLLAADLAGGTGLASWHNSHDRVVVESPDHHTLSLYVNDGYESYLKTKHGWRNGGAPDRMCLMPQGYASTWDIRGPLSFVHFYFTDAHLRDVAEKVWDKSPTQLSVDERIFADDAQIATLYRQFLLSGQWHDNSDQLMLGTAATLLLNQLVQKYCRFQWQPVTVRGGLAPYQLARAKAWIEAHIDQPILLAELAALVDLSEYHFARMFKQSQGLAPHQYVMQQRLQLAQQLLQHTRLPLTDIAGRCGFSSSSHFSNRFRQTFGMAPSAFRQS